MAIVIAMRISDKISSIFRKNMIEIIIVVVLAVVGLVTRDAVGLSAPLVKKFRISVDMTRAVSLTKTFLFPGGKKNTRIIYIFASCDAKKFCWASVTRAGSFTRVSTSKQI